MYSVAILIYKLMLTIEKYSQKYLGYFKISKEKTTQGSHTQHVRKRRFVINSSHLLIFIQFVTAFISVDNSTTCCECCFILHGLLSVGPSRVYSQYFLSPADKQSLFYLIVLLLRTINPYYATQVVWSVMLIQKQPVILMWWSINKLIALSSEVGYSLSVLLRWVTNECN